jgi:hypothetical protein
MGGLPGSSHGQSQSEDGRPRKRDTTDGRFELAGVLRRAVLLYCPQDWKKRGRRKRSCRHTVSRRVSACAWSRWLVMLSCVSMACCGTARPSPPSAPSRPMPTCEPPRWAERGADEKPPAARMTESSPWPFEGGSCPCAGETGEGCWQSPCPSPAPPAAYEPAASSSAVVPCLPGPLHGTTVVQ